MASFSYAKSYRLKTRYDFARCRQGQSKKLLGSCVVYFRKNSLAHARIGCTITKKMGNACERNLFRRRVREAFRTNVRLKRLPFDIHIIPQKSVQTYSWTDIKELLEQCLFLIEPGIQEKEPV